jgi:hypothetical protein
MDCTSIATQARCSPTLEQYTEVTKVEVREA